MKVLRCWLISLILAATTMTAPGCSQQQRTQDLKERTADATAEAKRDAKAVAQGIREGWNRDKPLNLNTATKEQLTSLPGVTAAEADRVIAGRPYKNPDELVTRHIIRKTEYDKFANRVTATK
ncbi:MAG: helix-hairpin-helix domain-containing protein [Terriglobia bacterium]|nr:helix-hairpin-helix domain-containing protein [Terriglobia bacterium]